jgi:hypothetical protein
MERDFRARMREAAGESVVDEDEGFVEGAAEEEAAARELKREGKRREPGDGDVNYEAAARKAGLPPQTVVARVIRELEDDFTHYKRYLYIHCVWFYVADAWCFFFFQRLLRACGPVQRDGRGV